MENNTVYEWLLSTTFTVSARAKSLQQFAPHLSAFVHAGDEILDLCCGAGFASFWMAERGARVTGLDFAPYMIAEAKVEAARRNLAVEFVEADIFTHVFGWERFNLVTCFDSVSDFPINDFARLEKKIADTLKPNGRFIVKYMDGSYKYIQGTVAREGVYQEAPERIAYRFKEYLPEVGASVNIIRNETRGEEYERRGYVYTAPIVRLALRDAFDLEQHIALDNDQFVDVFAKRA